MLRTSFCWQGGSLVSIHHEAENAAVFLMAQDDLPVWLGLRAVR